MTYREYWDDVEDRRWSDEPTTARRDHVKVRNESVVIWVVNYREIGRVHFRQRYFATDKAAREYADTLGPGFDTETDREEVMGLAPAGGDERVREAIELVRRVRDEQPRHDVNRERLDKVMALLEGRTR